MASNEDPRYLESKLIYEKEDLLAPILPGMAQPPHSMIDDYVKPTFRLHLKLLSRRITKKQMAQTK